MFLWLIATAQAFTVTLPHAEATVDLRDASGSVTVPVTLDLAGTEKIAGCIVDDKPVTVQAKRLRCGGRTTELTRPVTPVSEGKSCQVTVQLATADLLTGDCSLDLVVAAGASSVRAPVLVVHVPVPKMEVKVSPLHLEQWAPWSAPEDIALRVTESSGLAGISDLRADWIPGVTESGTATRGEVRCSLAAAADAVPQAPIALPRNATHATACRVAGFEYGKVTGTLRFTGQPLATPLDVPIEIRTIFSPVIIPFVVGVGLLCGSVLRKRLEPEIARSEARAVALATMRRIAERRAATRDPVLAQRLGELLDRLKNAMEAEQTAEGIANVEKDVDAQVTKAQEIANQRFAELETRSRDLTTAIDVDWELPPAAAPAQERARSAVRNFAAQVATGDTRRGAEARQEAEEAVNALATELRGELKRLARIAEDSPPIVEAALGKALRTSSEEARTSDAKGVPGLVHAAYALHRQLPAMVGTLREALLDALRGSDELADLAKQHAPRLEAEAPRDPSLAATFLQAVAGPADKAIRAKLLGLARQSADPHGLVVRVDEALTQGRYLEAARLFDVTDEGATGLESIAEAVVTRIFPIASVPRAAPVALAALASPALSTWIESASRTVADETRRLRTVYYVFVSVGILAIATVNTLPTWVGTPQDFVELFGWALGLDLGSKLLFELATKVAKTP